MKLKFVRYVYSDYFDVDCNLDNDRTGGKRADGSNFGYRFVAVVV